MFYIKNEVKS